MPKIKRIWEILIEIGIGVAIVGIIFVNAMYIPEGFWPPWLSLRVVGMAAFTFGYPLKAYRKYWQRSLFWVAFLVMLAAHLTFFTFFWPGLGTLWLGLMSPLEWIAILPILERAGTRDRNHHHHSRPKISDGPSIP